MQLITVTETCDCRVHININIDGSFFGSFVSLFSQDQQNLQIRLLLHLFLYLTVAAPPPHLPPPPPPPVAPVQPSQSSAYTTAQREPPPAPSSWISPTSGEKSVDSGGVHGNVINNDLSPLCVLPEHRWLIVLILKTDIKHGCRLWQHVSLLRSSNPSSSLSGGLPKASQTVTTQSRESSTVEQGGCF